MTGTPTNPLQLSDEDFMNLPEPDAPAAAAVDDADGQGAEADPAADQGGGSDGIPPADPAPNEGEDKPAEGEQPGDEGDASKTEGEQPAADPSGSKEGEASASGEDAPKTDEQKQPAVDVSPLLKTSISEIPVEQKANLLDEILKPFKANGKTIELRTPQEAVQLMQMGANYTKKLQELQPHRKVLMMLENSGLLDEGKLSFLIDLERKDPEAIKKLVKDSGIDPMDIDITTDPNYVPGAHVVSDSEASFKAALDAVASDPDGRETLTRINTQWDTVSKQALWQSPELLHAIDEQRKSGIYDVITAEVDRQRTLGYIPANTPFLQAYKMVGDAMAEAALGNAGQSSGTPETPSTSSTVLDTRVAAPKSPVKSDDKVAGASSTRSTPKTAEVRRNPLELPDEEFLKQMHGRV